MTKIMILAEELKTSLGVFYRSTILEIQDSERLQQCAQEGLIEYCNPAQVGLFDDN